MDKIDGDSPYLFDSMVAILLYVDVVVMLSKSGVGLQSILNKLHEFFIFSSLEVNLSKSKNCDLWLQQKEIKPRGTLPRQGPNEDNLQI